jgi:hypothetical protein
MPGSDRQSLTVWSLNSFLIFPGRRPKPETSLVFTVSAPQSRRYTHDARSVLSGAAQDDPMCFYATAMRQEEKPIKD